MCRVVVTWVSAVCAALQVKNFIHAASFATRLMELGASAGNATLMTKVRLLT
jgi:hypothetical protein